MNASLLLASLCVLSATPEVDGDEPWDEASAETVRDVQPVTEQMVWYSDAYPTYSRGLNMLFARPLPTLVWEFVVNHRTNAAIRDNTFTNYLGFDASGLKVGIASRFGLARNLDMGIYRQNNTNENFDTYESDLRYRFIEQARLGVNIAARAGFTLRVIEGKKDQLGGFGQLLADRLFANRVLLGLNLMFHSRSTGRIKTSRDEQGSLAVGILADVRITALLAWSFEISQTLAGYGEDTPVITSGVKFITNRHMFALVFTNTQYTAADGLVTNSSRPGKDIMIGFNIGRELSWW